MQLRQHSEMLPMVLGLVLLLLIIGDYGMASLYSEEMVVREFVAGQINIVCFDISY